MVQGGISHSRMCDESGDRIPSNISQVEDEIFCVPQCEFEESSEIFADMFNLPPGANGNVEGTSKDIPIVLEGYKKEDLRCLLRVMYPR